MASFGSPSHLTCCARCICVLWLLKVSTSRYWFNYRHTTNALTIYHRLRRAGVSDDNIVLMLADDFACDPRNPERGRMYNDLEHSVDIYSDVSVDYRGNDVSARNFLNVLSGRHVAGTAATQRLQSDGSSDLLVYMTGHGGDEFLKFRDYEEMTANDLAIAISEAHIGQRYRERTPQPACDAHAPASDRLTAHVVRVLHRADVDHGRYVRGAQPLGVLDTGRHTGGRLCLLLSSHGELVLERLRQAHRGPDNRPLDALRRPPPEPRWQ